MNRAELLIITSAKIESEVHADVGQNVQSAAMENTQQYMDLLPVDFVDQSRGDINMSILTVNDLGRLLVSIVLLKQEPRTMTERKLKVRYWKSDPEYADIKTQTGFYICVVQRCAGESRRKFRQRVRSLQHAIECYDMPLITLDPDVC